MRKPRILIVEDELVVAMDLQMTLREAGYSVGEPVGTAEEAIQRAREECPDLILMDISLSDLTDGLDAAASIKEKCDLPIVFITGWSDPSILSRAVEISPGGCLLKPVAAEDLLQVVANAIEARRLKRPGP